MKAAYSTFRTEVDELRSHIASTGTEEDLYARLAGGGLGMGPDDMRLVEEVRGSITRKRRFNHFLAFIVLYGALERFVDNAVHYYLHELLRLCDSYEQVPKKIRENNRKLAIELLWQIKENKARSEHDVNSIISRLAHSLDGRNQPDIISEAFTLQSTNTNFDRIRRILGNLEMQLDPKRLGSSSRFRGLYERLHGETPDVSSSESARRLFSCVDDLVQKRNEIAHGVASLDDIEDSNLLLERIGDIENFVCAVVTFMEQELLLFCRDNGILRELGAVIHVYDNSIVCFHHTSGRIAVGDVIAMPNNANQEPVRYGLVESLEIDGISHAEIDGDTNRKIGVKVDFKASTRQPYFLVPSRIRSVLSV